MKRINVRGRDLFSLVMALALLLSTTSARADLVAHEITLTPTSLAGTPFGLESLEVITARFIIDDSILQVDGVYDLDSFSLMDPIKIGDATFSNADLQTIPGGRVVNGELVQVFFLFQFVDPVEGQRRLETTFSPAFDWIGTDFNPGGGSSEFVFGTYAISTWVPPQATDIGLSRVIVNEDFLDGHRLVRAFVATGSDSPHALCTFAENDPGFGPLRLAGLTVMCRPREFNGEIGVGIAIFLPALFKTDQGFELHLTLYHAGARNYAEPIPCPAEC